MAGFGEGEVDRAYVRSGASGFISLNPSLNRALDQMAICSVFGSTLVAMFLFVLSWFSMLASYNDGNDTDYGSALYGCIGILSLLCTISGCYTVFTTKPWYTLAFACYNAAIAIVILAVGLRDITSGDCEDSPSPTNACASPVQHAMGYVFFFFVVLGVLWCARRVHRIKKEKRYFELVAGPAPVGYGNEDDDAVSVQGLDSDSGVELSFGRI